MQILIKIQKFYKKILQIIKAVVLSCSVNKKFLKILHDSQEKTCATVSFLIKLQALDFFIQHLRWQK